MSKNLKIGTWNVCLGMSNKKDIITDTLAFNKVEVCCLQETEIPLGFPEKSLNCGGYNIELEWNSGKKRVGTYIKTGIDYLRRNDLEKENFHVVIIDLNFAIKIRVINLYRSFRPPGMLSPNAFFNLQLDIVKKALTSNCFVMGDFNLDAKMENRADYHHKIPLEYLTTFSMENNLIQTVYFDTWSRVINGIKKASLLDHVYANNIETVGNVFFKEPIFGDHVLALVELNLISEFSCNLTIKRKWSNYCDAALKNNIAGRLASINNDFVNISVQQHWNKLEQVLINSVDELAPLIKIKINGTKKSLFSPTTIIKTKLNKRKRLLKLDRLRNNCANAPSIKLLNKEIRGYFQSIKTNRVKEAAMGNKANLWKAVKMAKDQNVEQIPKNLTLAGLPIAAADVPNSFAAYFNEKVENTVARAKVINQGLYNGTCKLMVQNRNFMTRLDVRECMLNLKSKRCEGFDRIPVCALYDARDVLLDPLATLFEKIYASGQIPEQWKIAKIIPLFKKGNKVQIENYRPIANLCSGSKIFEKLILKQIYYLESKNKLDLTGKQQHGFKRNKSTSTVGTLLQSLIARAADNDCYVVMASLDLSMAFDIVNTELLVKRLRVMGMPDDLIRLVRAWLTGRSFYVQVGDNCSSLYDSNVGTIQGSVLGPVLYALFVSPLFDLVNLTNFADDNFCIEWDRDLCVLIDNLEKKLEMITKWLRSSGLVVNESKTEVCLFHKNDKPQIIVRVNNVQVLSQKTMNVLGVIFDSKLNWNAHIAKSICKARKALLALRLLKRYFDFNEMKILLDSNFYSILYYNSIIWLTPGISADCKQRLLSISANALKSCLLVCNNEISFENVHRKCKKCTPEQIMMYHISLKLHKLLNENGSGITFEQVTVMDQIVCTRRQLRVQILRNNRSKIGMNTTANKLYYVNNLISFDLLNKGFVLYKKLMKIQFLKYGNT